MLSFPMRGVYTRQVKEQWRKEVRASSCHESMLEEIKAEGERLLNENPVRETFSLFQLYEKTGSRLEYERVYFQKRRRLNTFALLSFLEPHQARYKEEVNNAVWAICDEFTWCLPAHLPAEQSDEIVIDLFAAETAMALAEILDILDETIDPVVRKRAKAEIQQRILLPYRKQTFEWETATHNWASVCAGSIGIAALYLIEDKGELDQVIGKVLQTMKHYLKGFSDDGACTEGYGYWQYGFGYFIYFADLLHLHTNGDIDLFQSEKVHQIALFQQKCFLYDHRIANFSDSLPETKLFLGISHYLNSRFPDVHVPDQSLRAHYTDDHCSRWAPAWRNLLWVRDKPGEPWPDTSVFLKDAQWLISRHYPYAFAAKGGHNAEHHNHNDIGHFILSAADTVYLQDIGSGMYNKDYFQEKRYSFLCNGSHGHSVPLINGSTQAEGQNHAAVVLKAALGEQIDELTIEMAGAYQEPSLQSLKRTFKWVKHGKPSLALTDVYHFSEKPKSVVERLAASVMDVEALEEGIVIGGKLLIKFDADKLSFTKEITEYSDHFGRLQQVMLLNFTALDLKEHLEIELNCIFL